MDIEENYFKKYIITAIAPDGSIINEEKDESEENHYQSYIRLDNKLGGIIGYIDKRTHSSYNLPNIVAKLGYINIYPEIVLDDVETTGVAPEDFECVIFPYKPTKSQLECLIKLYKELEQCKNVSFFKKPSIENELKDKDKERNLEKLKKYVQQLMDELDKDIENNRGYTDEQKED